jgi:hypothetical protein
MDSDDEEDEEAEERWMYGVKERADHLAGM